VIIFGNFNIIPTASEFEALVTCNYSYVIQQNTNISLKNSEGSACMDNIWLSSEAQALSTGRIYSQHKNQTVIFFCLGNSGVIRDKLSSMWIPAGWTWGGLVSDHCPIWIEFDLS
jgi:exonuclease III